MTSSSNPTLDPARHELLRAKFGRYLDWRVPLIENTVGPFDPSVFDRFDARRRSLVDSAVSKLLSYTEEEIEVLAAPGRRDAPPKVDWGNFLDHNLYRLKESEPPWYAGGFGHPDHVADFEHWCKMPRFTVEEAVYLSIGIEPGHLAEKFDRRGRNRDERATAWPTLIFLFRRHEQLNRQFDSQGHGWHVQPLDFLDWARSVEFQAHPEFLRLLERYHCRPKAPAAAPSRPPDKRAIDTIAQLFTAMAIDSRGYRPGDARSPIPREIADLAASMGLEISDDTVRKYLKIGASFIPEDWKPE